MAEKKPEKKDSGIEFINTYANDYRSITPDNYVGLKTPMGMNLEINFFTAHQYIDDISRLEKVSKGLYEETVAEKQVERRFETSIVLNPTLAKQLKNWLEDELDKVEKKSQKNK